MKRLCVLGSVWLFLMCASFTSVWAASPTCVKQGEIIDLLHFTLPVQNKRMMLRYEQRVWAPFLKKQPGFVSKQILLRTVRGVLQVTLLNTWKDQASYEAGQKAMRDTGPESTYPGVVYQGGGAFTVYHCE